MELAKEWIAIISAIIGLIVSAVPLVMFLLRTIKNAKKNWNWSLILQSLPNLIMKAEEFISYSGLEKKEWVKTALKIYCIENNILFDADKFEAEITNLVDLTKKVNARGTTSKTGV